MAVSSKTTSSALVPVNTKQTDLVEEQIDERILSILGLQDVFDFTYEEYYLLLKEKAVAARMTQQEMPTESIELITDELKRVKGKTGKFKIKVKKIDIDKVLDRKTPSPQKAELDPNKLLPPAAEEAQNVKDDKEEVQKDILDFLKNDLLDSLKSINSVVTDILDVLKEQRAIDKKKSEQDRKNIEVEKKRKKEEKLEGGIGKGMSAIVSTIAKPFTSFFDTIKNFFMNILMGSAINFLLAVIKDPSIILTPLKNFANMIIGFLNGIISFMWNMIVSPINFVLNGINAGIQGLINQINNAIKLIPGAKPITAPQLPTVPGPPQIPTFPVQQQEGGGETINLVQRQVGGGETINIGDISLMSGGGVDNKTGLKVSGFGKDTQLTALSPGEVVFSNPAADFWGRDNLLAMNAMGGGTNKPKFGALGGIQTMQGGGVAGGGQVGLDQKYGIHRVRKSIRKVNQGLAPKGLLIVPGHTYGGGTTGATEIMGEFKANKIMAQFIVQQVKQRNPNIPVQYYEKMFEDSDQGLTDAVQHYKKKEQEGYEVIEIHHDAFGPQGLGAGLLGSYTGFSPLDAALGQNVGSFGANYKGRFEKGYAMNRGGISMVELAKLEGSYEQGLLKGSTEAKTASAQPVIKAILDTYGGTRPNIVQPPSTQPRVTMLPIPVGGGQQAPTSSATPGQPDIPAFSPEDPMNMSTLVVKAIYNMVG